MGNVLINAINLNTDGKNEYALVPEDLLRDYNLDQIDGMRTGHKNQKIGDQIFMIFDRLGLEPFHPYLTDEEMRKFEERVRQYGAEKAYIRPPFRSEQDLKKFLNPKFPITVGRILTIFCD